MCGGASGEEYLYLVLNLMFQETRRSSQRCIHVHEREARVYEYATYMHCMYNIILQRIRERLIRDYGFIDHLCPEPRLISDSCDPSMLGASKGKIGIFPTDDHFPLREY